MKIAVDTLAYVSESMVFLFLGVGVISFNQLYNDLTVETIIFAMINLNVARFLNISIVSYFCNKTRSDGTKINKKQQFVMWIAGLRGAMAYALALDAKARYGRAGAVMLVITLIYSLFTILGVSSFLYPVMKKCEVTRLDCKNALAKELSSMSQDELELMKKLNKERRNKNCCFKIKRGIINFDRYNISPLFIKNIDLKRSQKDD